MRSERCRALLILTAITLLAACNTVIGERPLLHTGTPAAVVPRPGLWLSGEPDCTVSIARPARDWPACAHWLILDQRGTITLTDKDETDRPAVMTLPIRFGQRDPSLAELRLDGLKDTSIQGYAYVAYAADGAGQGRELTKVRFWWVKCGPSQNVKYAGIDDQCRPASLAAIVNAARKGSDASVQTMRWVRPPGPGDRPTSAKSRR